MSSRNPRRCVFGCNTEGVTIHDFPNPKRYPKEFQIWVDIIGESLANLRTEQIYRNKKVCHIHFTEKDWNRNNRLNALAVPSLHLPVTAVLTTATRQDCKPTPSTSALPTKAIPDALNIPITTKMPLLDLTNLPSSSKAPVKAGGLPRSIASDVSNFEVRTVETPDHSLHLPSRPVRFSKGSRKSPTLQLPYYKNTQRTIKNLRREILRLRKRSKLFKSRLANAEKLTDDLSLIKVTKDMTAAAKLFTDMQFRQTKKHPKGRRFSLNQKILSLSLYKRSPKGYGLLSKCFTLPSPKTLKNLLSKIKLEPGINKLVFKKIKKTASEMNTEDRLCTLIFDEMYITPQLKYNISKDEIKGFVTNGHKEIADHALVFMVKGIKKSFKQPVAYYFTQSLRKNELKAVLKDVVKHVSATGLNILCTICDQSTVNVSTINSLIEDTRQEYIRQQKEWKFNLIEIGKKKIIPLYDVPHLLKGLRNNLMSKDLKYVDFENDNKEVIIKWRYFQELYEADKSYGELRYLHKLTEEHIDPSKINKMKVKPAAQIFSHSVAVAAEHITARGNLSSECRNVIPFVLLIDKLFDSLNVSTFHPLNGKMYKGAVKPNSPHHKLWCDAIRFLKNVCFLTVKKEGAKLRMAETIVPSIKNFIKTIEGFQQLWKIVHQKYNFDSMLTRNFNQDPIENFFGNIRSLGARNVSPDCVGFEGAFKALLLNNYCSRHSLKGNCEEDINSYLQSLDFFINEKDNSKNHENISEHPEFILTENLIDNSETVPNEGSFQRNYVCGWVVKKCLKNVVKSCQDCRNKIITTRDNMVSNSFIVAKEYDPNKQWLVYPSQEVVRCFYNIQTLIINYLKTNLRKKNLKSDIKIFTDIFAYFPFDCETHRSKLRECFEENVINIILCSWCRSINRILSGKIPYDGDDDDPTKLQAQTYFNKHRHNNTKNKK